jgi:hypothetical protein
MIQVDWRKQPFMLKENSIGSRMGAGGECSIQELSAAGLSARLPTRFVLPLGTSLGLAHPVPQHCDGNGVYLERTILCV